MNMYARWCTGLALTLCVSAPAIADSQQHGAAAEREALGE
jgi:hypothetical protein